MAHINMTLLMLNIIKTLLLNKQRNRNILMKRLKSLILRCMKLIINHTLRQLHIKLQCRLKRLLRLMLTMTRSMDRELVIQNLKWFQLMRSWSNFMILTILMNQLLMSKLLLTKPKLMLMRDLMLPQLLMSIID